jgi:hypothetical protein
MKLNIPKITKDSYQNMINAYKNKEASNGTQLSHTLPLIQI